MRVWGLLLLSAAMVGLGQSAFAQTRTDLSGTWTRITDPDIDRSTGPTRGGRGGGGGVVTTASGAPVNCGLECTIVQTEQTVTVSRPPDPGGVKPFDVVLNLGEAEGMTMQAQDQRMTYGARWEADKLIVTHSIALISVAQSISLENGTLSIATTFTTPDGHTSSLTFRYKKKVNLESGPEEEGPASAGLTPGRAEARPSCSSTARWPCRISRPRRLGPGCRLRGSA